MALDVSEEHELLTDEMLRVTGGLLHETQGLIVDIQRGEVLHRRIAGSGLAWAGDAQRVNEDVACTSRTR